MKAKEKIVQRRGCLVASCRGLFVYLAEKFVANGAVEDAVGRYENGVTVWGRFVFPLVKSSEI